MSEGTGNQDNVQGGSDLGNGDHGSETQHQLPNAPDPSQDPGVVPSISSPPPDEGHVPEDLDVFKLTPVAALKMLCSNVETLMELTENAELPPTPPLGVQSPRVMAIRSPELRAKGDSNGHNAQSPPCDHIDGVPFTHAHIGSPEEMHHHQLQHGSLNSPPILPQPSPQAYLQHNTLARKFTSKKPPPISLSDYLLRVHRYCPLSVGVYLAASNYIYRLAIIEGLVPVTPRNVHRLVLAALRVAMKALEDLCYPHKRFARVGGVREGELGRLEVALLFLLDWEVRVEKWTMEEEAKRAVTGLGGLNDDGSAIALGEGEADVLSMLRQQTPAARLEKRKASMVLQQEGGGRPLAVAE